MVSQKPAVRPDRVRSALDELAQLASAADTAAVDALRRRISSRRLRVLIAGEAKRGKSTLVNQLLGDDVMPTGRLPVTAIATTVRRSTDPIESTLPVQVTFLDGRTDRVALRLLPDLITEHLNPGNEKSVDHVDVVLGAGPLDDVDVELVDTPGTGTIFTHNTMNALSAYQGLDAAIFVVTADPPMSAAERDLLTDIAARAVHTMVFVNKTDLIGADEVTATIHFTEQVCAQAAHAAIPIYAGSAQRGPADPGFAQFAAAFHDYLADRARTDADAALLGHIRRLATSLLDTDRIGLRGLDLLDSEAGERIQLFRNAMDDIQSRYAELDDQAWAAQRGLRRSLDVAADELRPDLTGRCTDQVAAALRVAGGETDPDEMDRQGRQVAAEMVTAEVDRWREEQAVLLQQGLVDAAQRLAAASQQHMTALRIAARQFMGVDLSTNSLGVLLEQGRAFWYLFDRPASIELPFAAAVRRWAPGSRRRARERLLAELPGLVDRQVGRARAHLQERLQESMRGLVGEWHRDHEDLIARLRGALDDAMTTLHAGQAARAAKRAELGGRVDHLSRLVDSLN